MYQTFFSRCELKESTEVFDADNFSCKELPCLKISCDHFDHMSSLVHSSLIYAADRYCAFIADIDLYTCTLDNSIDSLSSLTNHITDLLRVDLDLDDLRSVFIYIVTRLCNTL